MNVREPLLSGIRDNHSRGKVADFLTERVEAVEVIDRVLRMTDRVLNPAAHGHGAPLYEAEVRQALNLVDRLQKGLDRQS